MPLYTFISPLEDIFLAGIMPYIFVRLLVTTVAGKLNKTIRALRLSEGTTHCKWSHICFCCFNLNISIITIEYLCIGHS